MTAMTVKQLITELQKFPEDLPVMTEAVSDCRGEAVSVTLEQDYPDGQYVSINRS